MRRRLVAVTLGLAAALAACGGSGIGPASSGPPAGGQTSPSAAASRAPTPGPSRGPSAEPSTPVATTGPASSPAATESPMPEFSLTSTAFDPGGEIPRRFSCDGEDVSPDLSWTAVPAGTAALTLVVDDPDASGFVHWLVLDMTASESGSLPRAVSASPDAPPQGTNDFGRLGWGGPCPPSGTHRYVFTLYALAAPLALPGAPRGGDVRRALEGANVLGTAVLEGRYRRQR